MPWAAFRGWLTRHASAFAPAEPTPLEVLPLLLITFPMAVALARTPWLVGMVAVGYLFLAHHLRCLHAFVLTYGVAILLNLPILSAFAYFGDVDFYLGPQVRQLAAGRPLLFDGALREVHLLLPTGYTGWCAALYRLTGSIDFGHAQIFALIVAAWQVLRAFLNRWQTAALICAPLTITSLYSAMSDGCVYLLLVIALFALRARHFWMTLAAIAVAMTCKSTAWIPGVLIGGCLLWQFPRRWPTLAVVAVAVLALLFPTLRMMAGGGLTTISEDFLGADAAAKSLGYLGRMVYFYLGHWLVPGDFGFNVHIGGVDGAGMDGLGAVARVVVWPSLIGLWVWRKHLSGWWLTVLLAWGSVLLMPTLYVGYGRYVPLGYLALLLPFVVRCPKVSVMLSAVFAAMPLVWCLWRMALAMECAQVVAAGGPVQSEWYNVRAGFRSCGVPLVEQPQAVHSSSGVYTYAAADFPPIPPNTPRGRLVPAGQKARYLLDYIRSEALPWFFTHAHTTLFEVARIRWHWLTSPRGVHDELPAVKAP